MANRHTGGSFDDFLQQEGIFDEVQAIAIKRVVAWQLEEFRVQNELSKAALAKQLHTSRSALDRLLDPENTSVTLSSLASAIAATGKKLEVRIA